MIMDKELTPNDFQVFTNLKSVNNLGRNPNKPPKFGPEFVWPLI
jgi:hypothetical protein